VVKAVDAHLEASLVKFAHGTLFDLIPARNEVPGGPVTRFELEIA
jgi:hypothetical protein